MLARCDPQRRDWEWNYLKRSAEANYRRVSYPSDICLDVAFSANGKYLAALVSKNGVPAKPALANVSVALFDPETYQFQRMLEVPGVALDAPMEWWRPRLNFSADGDFIALYGTFPEGEKLQGAVRCFDGTKDWEPMKLKIDLFRDQVVMGVFFDKDRLYALTHDLVDVNHRDNRVEFRVVDVLSGDVKVRFSDSIRQSSPQLNRDSSILIVAGGPKNVIDFNTGEVLPFGDLQKTHRYKNSVVISSDDEYIASVDNSGRIYIFDYATRKKLREIEAHIDGAYDLAFTALNKEIVTVGADGAMKRWRISDGELLGKLNIGEPLRDVAVHPKTGEVVAPTTIGTLAVWNPSESNALQSHDPASPYYPQQLDFCGDGSRIFALESTMHLTVWDAATKERIQAIEFRKYGHVNLPDALSIAPTRNGKLAAIQRGKSDNLKHIEPLEVWDIDQGKLVSKMPLTTSPPLAIVWDHEEKILAAKLSDRTLVGFDVASRQQIWEVKNDYAGWIGRHPKSGKLYVVESGSVTAPSRIRILDMQTGREVKQLSIDKPALRVRRFSFDGKLLLASIETTRAKGFRPEIAMIDSETGEVRENFPLGTKPGLINDLFLSSDGKRLFTQLDYYEFRIWDRQERELILSLRDPYIRCEKLALAQDGLAVVGTSTGRGFYLWDGRPGAR
jgi:WD40 repeat protein